MTFRVISGAVFILAIVILAIVASPALACEGYLSDDFTADIGTWAVRPYGKIGGGKAEVSSNPGQTVFMMYQVFTFNEFDVCVDLTYPEAKDPNGGTEGGIAFWFKDIKNFYVVSTTPIGGIGAYRYVNDEQSSLINYYKQDSLKPGAGQKNSLRV